MTECIPNASRSFLFCTFEYVLVLGRALTDYVLKSFFQIWNCLKYRPLYDCPAGVPYRTVPVAGGHQDMLLDEDPSQRSNYLSQTGMK